MAEGQFDPATKIEFDGSITLNCGGIWDVGSDVPISYYIFYGAHPFFYVELTIRNADGTVIHLESEDTSWGNHNVTWYDTKWTYGDHVGAYANPRHGWYTVRISGYYIDENSDLIEIRDEKTLTTTLVIEADTTDTVPGGAVGNAVASGLAHLADCLEVRLSKGATTVAASSITLTNITNGKHIRATGNIDSLDDGQWKVELKDVRDDIGNFLDVDGGTSGVQHYSWNITLY